MYIMSSLNNRTIYTGVTSRLPGRVWEHKEKIYPASFTARYNCVKLVWYEFHITIEEAIVREKQIKRWKRAKKIKLIELMNPEWKDLYEELDW